MVNLGNLIVEEKETTIDGKNIKYLECWTDVDGTIIKFNVKPEYKELLKFMIK